MSCGAAFLDYDNDGWLDILVLTGSRFGDPPPDSSQRLYKNNRDGTFTDVTRSAGLWRTGYQYGVTIGDYNNDGFEDFFITGWQQNTLYRNNGNGTFSDVTQDAGLWNATPRFGSGCSFLDYDRDGRLDLFVSNYVTFDAAKVPRAGSSGSCNFRERPGEVFCGPTRLALRGVIASITITATALSPRSPTHPGSVKCLEGMASQLSRRTLTTTAGPISMWRATPHPVCSFTIITTGLSVNRDWRMG